MPIVQANNVKIGGRAILYEVHGDAIIFQIGDGQYSEAERDMIRDHISNAVAFKLPDINSILRKHSLNQSIITLPCPKASAYSDFKNQKKIGPCFKGTREALLQEMADWVSGAEETKMYVLSGLAGIGKSTVAYTIASRADELGLLGASFFFSRDEKDRNNAEMFFTAIAYQLCLYSEEFAQAIGSALLTERGSAAIRRDPREQLEALILMPLRSIVQSRIRPILIVVDALDECDEEDGDTVLSMLCRLVRDLPSFNIILTTRPHPNFDHLLASQDDHKIFRLQDIEDKVVDGDIRLYLTYSLSLQQVQKRFPKQQWHASDEQIDSLVRVVGRPFIIASTAVRFILDKFASNPAAQMQKLLQLSTQDHAPFKDLDHFYTVILRSVVPADCDNHDIVSRYQSVVGAIVLVQHPLPVITLTHLIDVEVEPPIYHITDSKRCRDINLHIDPRIHHTRISMYCFRVMERHLKYNILGLSDLARFLSNEHGQVKDGITDEQLHLKIPQQLEYACVYLANHLNVTNLEDADLMKELEVFANQRMLYWFEALSLIRKLESAHHAIRLVLNCLPRRTSSDLRQLLTDGLRFISKFYEIIKISALHAYYSALPFTPTESLFYRRYIKEALHNVCDINGVWETWDTLVAQLIHGGEIDAVQFSLDSTMLASQNKKGDRIHGALKVWDAATGIPISTIRGSSFAVANDFSIVASSEDKTITLYNVNGSERGATFTTQAKISEVAISSESSRIAAVSDGTVCLWNSRNGDLIGSYKNDSYGHCCIQFSATGARLAYLSANGVAKLRNGIDGGLIANLDCGSMYALFWRIMFSPDGSRIAASGSSSDLKLWSCENGELVGMAEDAGNRLAISPNGSLLATGDYCKRVKLWNGNNGNPLLLVEVLFLASRSMSFSSDDTLAITTDSDIRIYDVKNHSFVSAFSALDSNVLAFSPDSTRIVAGNRTVYLWDSRSIEAPGPSSHIQASGRITALALSRDCSRVAYGFSDGAIELWEIAGLALKQITARKIHIFKVTTLGFSQDGTRYASGSSDGTIHLWQSEDGALLGTTLYLHDWIYAMELSNSVLASISSLHIIVWDPKTLDRIHTFEGSFMTPWSLSANGALLAVTAISDSLTFQIIVFDVTSGTIIATLKDSHMDSGIRAMTFLLHNSQLIIQKRFPADNQFRIFNLADPKLLSVNSSVESIIQIPNMSTWHGAPIWVAKNEDQYYLEALFATSYFPVPVLWIPRELHVREWVQERSLIALLCEDGRVVFLRPHTSIVV